ncbi:Uncharacterised protein [Streptococcus pneumoniae]|nr:Uncharacterised protein [Streptococcus pneumoniae]
MFSIPSEYSFPNIPIECNPKANTPAKEPGPTAFINKRAITNSGNVRTKLSTNFPDPEVNFPLLIFVAAQKANGTDKNAEINVPNIAIANVSINPCNKSSPSGKDTYDQSGFNIPVIIAFVISPAVSFIPSNGTPEKAHTYTTVSAIKIIQRYILGFFGFGTIIVVLFIIVSPVTMY